MTEDNPQENQTQSFAPLAKGTQVARYRIIERVGVGGMGEVYLADDTELERRVALKFLPLQFLSDEELKARFKREAQAAAALDHPNIVTVYEVGDYQGRPFIAMQYVEGQSLSKIIKDKSLPLHKVIDLAIQICEGLKAAHEASIIHRDVKPSNICISAAGRPKLVDFGLASVRGSEKITRTGSTLGTVGYMSPEQIRGHETDHRSDLFSFGVVLYEMVTGRLPFTGDTEAAVIGSILKDSPEPLRRFKADLPDSLQQVINKALDKDSDTRYQTAAGMLADLKRIVKEFAAAETVPTPEKPIKRSYRGFLIPAAIVVVAVLVLILKPWKFEVGPSQEAVAAENRLAIMYFDNLADPSDSLRYGEIVTNLLITDLSESQFLQVVSSQRLYDILKLLGREGEKKIDREVASHVAQKAGAKWMLMGSILQMHPHILLTAQLVDVASGNAIATQRVSGEPGEMIFPLVDRLTVAIKDDISLPEEAHAEPDPSTADVTTSSPEAYRYFLEGWDYLYKYYASEALKSFGKALEYDSTFAMAYFSISMASSGRIAKEAIGKAVKYSDKVSQLEKYWIDAQAARVAGNYTRAIEILNRLLHRNPEEKRGYGMIGTCYWAMKQYDNAVRSLLKAIELDSLSGNAYNQLAYLYDEIGDFEKSIWAINKYIELAPDEPNPYDSRGDLYAYNGKLDEAIASYRKALEIGPDFLTSIRNLGNMYLFKGDYAKAESLYQVLASFPNKNTRANGRLHLAKIPLRQGKFQEALRILNVGIETDLMELGEGEPALTKHFMKMVTSSLHGSASDAIEAGKKVMDIAAAIGTTGGLGNDAERFLCYIYAKSGDTLRADSLLLVISQRVEHPQLSTDYLIPRAAIEFVRGNFDTAALYFKRADSLDAEFATKIFLARSHLGAGRLDDAVTSFERALKWYGESHAFVPGLSVLAHYWLGQAYEESGWSKKAVEQYETFLDIWKDADPGIEEIEDAKLRLARLKNTP